MPDLSKVTLESERLLMRPYKAKDAEQVWPVLCREEISAMTLRIPHPCPREFVEDWFDFIDEKRMQGIACEFGLFEKADGSYVGNCGLADILHRHNQADVVYFIAPEKWGRGFATEALREAVDYAFDRLHLERISGRCFADNAPSRRVMEKVGFVSEGVLRHDIFRDGAYRDVCCLGLLSGEWEQLKNLQNADR